MAKSEKYERLKENLRKGNVEGVKENLELEFMDGIYDGVWIPIHWAIMQNYIEIVKVLIENKCNIENENLRGWRPIHSACRYGRTELVNLLIEKKCNIESEDKKGMRPIHLASMDGNTEIANLLIKKKCNIESEDKNGMRPIHWACLGDHKEMVKLLIFHNCFINVNDYNGQTPLDWAKSKGHEEIVKLLSELDQITTQVNNSILINDDKTFAKLYKSDLLTGRRWLEWAFELKADKIINYFLNIHIDDTEMGYIKTVIENHSSESTVAELWEEVLLYKCIKEHYEKGFRSICRSNIINRPKKIIPCSFLEIAAESENFTFFHEIMKKTFYDVETWERSKEIALHKGCYRIHNSIVNREILLKCREKSNLSILHTAVCDNDPEMLEYILMEGLVDPNHNHEVLGTALAFAILLCHRECLTIFERFNIDCNSKNKYLQTPLHEAASNGMIEHCQYLMDRVENIDQAGFMGQTALHCAVIRGCEELCDRLVERGADFLRYMEFCHPLTEHEGTQILEDPLTLSKRENCLTLCVKMNKTIYPCFLKSLDRDKTNSTDDEGNSLLHLTAKVLEPQLCDVLLKVGADIDLLNKKENTPLFELLSKVDQQLFINNEDKIIETVKLFVQSGCDLMKSLKGDLSLVQIITKFNSERLLFALLPRQQNQLLEIDVNIFKIAFERNFFRFCETLSEKKTLSDFYPKDILTSSITTKVIKDAVKENCTTLLKSLVKNASDDVQQTVLEISLYHLAKWNDRDSFQCLLNIEINNPLCFENGETLLTRLLKEKELYFYERIIESKKNKKKYINLKNKKNQTPLQVAIEMDYMDLVRNHLIFETDILDNMDCEGRSALMQLFVKISKATKQSRRLRFMNAIKTIIGQGGNIYHETLKKEKAIEFCSSKLIREEIEAFQNDQSKSRNTVIEKIIEREKVVVVKEVELEKKNCAICLEREVDSVFHCGHTICEICSFEIERCPFCNLEPVQAKRIYFN